MISDPVQPAKLAALSGQALRIGSRLIRWMIPTRMQAATRAVTNCTITPPLNPGLPRIPRMAPRIQLPRKPPTTPRITSQMMPKPRPVMILPASQPAMPPMMMPPMMPIAPPQNNPQSSAGPSQDLIVKSLRQGHTGRCLRLLRYAIFEVLAEQQARVSLESGQDAQQEEDYRVAQVLQVGQASPHGPPPGRARRQHQRLQEDQRRRRQQRRDQEQRRIRPEALSQVRDREVDAHQHRQ